MSETDYYAQIQQAAEAASLDPLLVTCVVDQESSFDPNAESCCGALGLVEATKGGTQGMLSYTQSSGSLVITSSSSTDTSTVSWVQN